MDEIIRKLESLDVEEMNTFLGDMIYFNKPLFAKLKSSLEKAEYDQWMSDTKKCYHTFENYANTGVAIKV
jgi:hypothetical protein